MKIQWTNDNDTNLRCQCSALAKLHDELPGNLNWSEQRNGCARPQYLHCFCSNMRGVSPSLSLAFVSCILHCKLSLSARMFYCRLIVWSSSLNTERVYSDNGYININIFCAVLCVCEWVFLVEQEYKSQFKVFEMRMRMRMHVHRRNGREKKRKKMKWNAKHVKRARSNTLFIEHCVTSKHILTNESQP